MRVIKGLAALLALVALTAGIPAALILLGGNLLPDQLSWTGLRSALLGPDNGTVLLGLLTMTGWVAWLVFALSLLAEVVGLVSGRRIRLRLPGLAGPQRLVSGLLIAVITMLALPAASHASPEIAPTFPVAAPAAWAQATTTLTIPEARAATSADSTPTTPMASTPMATSAQSRAQSVIHHVQRGDDLWSLAEDYYGQGRDWRKIAAANPDVLTGGPDRLQPGWRLVIPDLESASPASDVVTVHEGDSLSSIAEASYGRGDRWRDIFDANRDQLQDPDQIDVGTRLRVPGAAATESKQPERGKRKTVPMEPGANRPERTPPPTAPETEDRAGAEQSRPGPPVPSAPVPSVPAPTRSVPSEAATTSARPPGPTAGPLPSTTSLPTEQPPADAGSADEARLDVAWEVAAVGGLLAASLIAGLSLRRRAQLQTRPLGRRIVHATAPAQAVETALGHRVRALEPGTLDLALRAVGAHCRHESAPLPALSSVILAPDRLELTLAGPVPDRPVGFQGTERHWLLARGDAEYLASVPGLAQAPRPYPALVTLGSDRDGSQFLVDLESWGLLALDSDDPKLVDAVLAAMAVELSFAPWADELLLTLVGRDLPLPAALGKHNVTRTDDVDGLLLRLERRAEAQRAHAQDAVLRQDRLDPDLTDAWVPEVVLVHQPLTVQQSRRLSMLTTTQPRVTLAAVTSRTVEQAAAVLRLASDPARGATTVTAVLEPLGLTLEPQLLPEPTAAAVVQLVSTTGSDETTPAPWWAPEAESPLDRPPDPPPENVTFLGKRFGGWGGEGSDSVKESVVMQERQGEQWSHPPVLRMLGPVELVGATGTPPPRAGKQCLEYCGWLLEHPGTSAQAMAAALVVAEGTRRSNMSRLRSWLGADDQGQPYLPDAYTGRILLHPSVSSDWQRLQILTAGGINTTSTPTLHAALELVRGAPLADAAPGQWHWAEELRTDMISAVRDIGVELTARALDECDVDLARWAASRALVAAPGDELLTAARIRTEHLAGNVAETERLTLQLAAQARSLGVDLNPQTVTLLQEVMEGRVRARLA